MYLKDGIKMLEELVYVRWNALTGVYNRSVCEYRPAYDGIKAEAKK
jgi:dolichyl-phosphate beta-glucosyltransferase